MEKGAQTTSLLPLHCYNSWSIVGIIIFYIKSRHVRALFTKFNNKSNFLRVVISRAVALSDEIISLQKMSSPTKLTVNTQC